MVAVVILLTRFCENVASGGNKLSNVISFIILPSGEVLISINKDNSSNVSGAKKCNEAFRGVNFLEYTKKTVIQISSWNLKLSNLNPLRL